MQHRQKRLQRQQRLMQHRQKQLLLRQKISLRRLWSLKHRGRQNHQSVRNTVHLWKRRSLILSKWASKMKVKKRSCFSQAYAWLDFPSRYFCATTRGATRATRWMHSTPPSRSLSNWNERTNANNPPPPKFSVFSILGPLLLETEGFSTDFMV